MRDVQASSEAQLTAIGMVFTGNSYARMSQAFVSRGMDKLAGFLVGWTMAGRFIPLIPLSRPGGDQGWLRLALRPLVLNIRTP
jgi:hypothetical protein